MKNRESDGKFTVVLWMDIGDITLDASEIKSFYFIEDVFSYTMVGKMIFTDNRGIFENGPLTGNEKIRLVYGDESNKELEFKIYKVNKVDQLSASSTDMEVIELLFAEEMFFAMNFFQFSKSWKDNRISNIIRNIGSKFLSIDNWFQFEETSNSLEYFYIPYWNLNTTIGWLSKRGIGRDTNQPGYCFYNNSQGGNFVTLEKLLSQKRYMGIDSNDDGLYVFNDPNTLLYNKILSWSISGIDLSSLPQLSGGVKRGYNSMEKKFIQKEFIYSDVLKRHTALGKRSLFPDISDKRVSYHNFGEKDEDIIDAIYVNNWNKKYVHQQCVAITVKGHEERYCGGMIEIKWPSGDIDEHYSKHFHGKYLVKSITHSFSGYHTPSYKQKMVCIKNAYSDSDAINLQKTTKQNLA